MELGIIKNIEEVFDLKATYNSDLLGKSGSRLSMSGMLHSICGYGGYDGYKIETSLKTFYILIENGQDCCESWGYLTTNDDLSYFIGKEINKISLTDMNLSNKELEELEYLAEGGVQFLTMYMTDGEILQFAVYNSHNGYYGHSIVILEDDKVLLQEVL